MVQLYRIKKKINNEVFESLGSAYVILRTTQTSVKDDLENCTVPKTKSSVHYYCLLASARSRGHVLRGESRRRKIKGKDCFQREAKRDGKDYIEWEKVGKKGKRCMGERKAKRKRRTVRDEEARGATTRVLHRVDLIFPSILVTPSSRSRRTWDQIPRIMDRIWATCFIFDLALLRFFSPFRFSRSHSSLLPASSSFHHLTSPHIM